MAFDGIYLIETLDIYIHIYQHGILNVESRYGNSNCLKALKRQAAAAAAVCVQRQL